jgi:putative addiction module killer protein
LGFVAYKLHDGNQKDCGDVAPVGEGVSEMRIDSGPGYRAYFKKKGDVATFLYGGDKASQEADIRKAKALAKGLEE